MRVRASIVASVVVALGALPSACQHEPERSAAVSSTVPARAPRCHAAGTWTDGPLFGTARGGHQARLLPDGLVLVWGGAHNAHERDVRPAESFDPAGQRDGVAYGGLPPEAVAAAPVPVPAGAPAEAAVVRLADGRLLVAGGVDARGAALATVTVDGCAAAPMRDPRAGAAAVLLPDGRVLVTGGRTGRVGDFDPFIRATELFTP